MDLSLAHWFGAFSERVSVHVIDSSRPLDLVNVFSTGEAGAQIVVWDDGDIEEMKEERKAWEVVTVRVFWYARH